MVFVTICTLEVSVSVVSRSYAAPCPAYDAGAATVPLCVTLDVVVNVGGGTELRYTSDSTVRPENANASPFASGRDGTARALASGSGPGVAGSATGAGVAYGEAVGAAVGVAVGTAVGVALPALGVALGAAVAGGPPPEPPERPEQPIAEAQTIANNARSARFLKLMMRGACFARSGHSYPERFDGG